MRALVAMLLVALSARANAADLPRAVELANRLAHAHGATRIALLADAATVPWPLLPSSVDADIATHLRDLPEPARRAWALDRALPIFAGELHVSDATTTELLAELRASATKAGGSFVDLEAARRDYAHSDMQRAAERYARITESSPLWPEALRERAWALFVEHRPAEALGATVSLEAPYFPGEDQAEARLLKATALLSKCRFDEARQLVAPLDTPLPPELSPADALLALETGHPPGGDVGQRAFDSPLVRRVRAALAVPAADAATNARRTAIAKYGATLLVRAYEDETDAARSIAERALDVRYEALHGERTLVEAGKTIGRPRPPKPAELGDDDVAWSFDGSWWRDELGRYRYAAGDACPPAQGGAGGPVDHARASRLFTNEGATLDRLASTTAGEERAEALLRLGDWDREAATRLRNAHGGNARDPEAEARLDAADRAFTEALALASKERRPQLLFELGDLRRSRGDLTRAAAPLAQLVDESPSHPLAVDAAMALGDDAFDAGRLADAVRRYSFARAHASDAGAKAYASYKLAWCRMNLEDYAGTRALFAEVIALSTAKGGRALSLADEARKDDVLALARDASVPAPKAVEEIRRLVTGERAHRYLASYARLIAGSGRDEEATKLLVSLEEGTGAGDLAGLYTTELQIATRRRDLPALVRAATRLADTCEEQGGVSKDVRDEAEGALRVAAVTIHGEGRAANDPARLQAALALYEAYFRAFDAFPGAYDLHHHAGELLMALGRPADAERQYSAAVERDLARLAKHTPPGRWLADSAHGAVEAAQAAMPPLALPDHATPAKEEDVDRPPPAPTAITPPEQTFVAACDRYLKALPQGPDAVDVAYRRALVFYRHHRFDDALPALTALAEAHPGDPTAVFAARLALDSLRVEHRYLDLAKLAATFENEGPLASKMGDELSDLREAALMADAARAAAHGDEPSSASRYLAFAKAFPHSARLDRALYNAAASLTRAGRLEEAVTTRGRLLAELPKSPLAARARERQLDDLLLLGRFADAEHLALELANGAQGKEQASRLHDAIVFAEAAGDRAKANALRERYLHDHPRGVDALTHATELAENARGCGATERAWTKALGYSRNLADRARLLDRLARAEDRCHLDAARRHAGEAAWLSRKLAKKDASALDASADAALIEVEPLLDAYAKQRLSAPYEKTIPKKLALLQKADQKLAAVIERGRAAPAACALVDSGLLYADLARELTKVKAPRQFNADQRQLFEDALQQKAQPLSDRATTALERALSTARDAGVEPACLAKALPALATLRPDRYAPRPEAVTRLTPAMEKPPLTAEEVLARAPDAPGGWLVAAKALVASNRPAAALVVAGRIGPKDPLSADAREVEARALEALGRHDEAMAAWHALAKDHPRHPLAHRVLADRALALGDFDGAKQQLDLLHAAAPADADVAIDLAVTLRALGQAKQAEELLRQVVKRSPSRLDASLDLGLLLCSDTGDPTGGLAALHAFQAGGGHPPDASKYAAAVAACQALAGAGGGK